MHVPDGFFNAATSVSAGVVAAAGVAVCLRGARRELDDRTAPMAGLVAAFIFAVQMLNFPVAAGTSGHLLGGALAAILVGPYTGVLCMTVVLLVQGVFFADGGLTALGVNVTIMGIVTVLAGWGVFRLVTALARGKVVVAAFLAALISVPASALVFTLLFWIGGTAPIEVGTVAVAMGGVHLLIGIGEALITAVTVGAVLAVRPDLVYGARGLAKPLELRGAGGTTTTVAGREPVTERRPLKPFLLGGVGLTLVLAGVVSFFASSSPDGLEAVAENKGFLDQAADHLFGGWALADYGEVGGIPVGVAGVLGVGLVLLIAGAVAFAARGRHRTADTGRTTDETRV
ncbi:energy-coupling factor ABC transporter permease [Nonomuraea gerenzanensis]|uniref:Substrate-specific component NikM of nickel ECF transporter n=1 Tax=Nonomuraea gerenzanensis TaxID=93944 RepID=A0A1M4DZF0_9ACTN|nr:energy-coupling factor ABC transporter permease [Nonomuraea gerenzanensis]UBU14245.1 energy-coupling factor ABC transporter permease [Nonomuraea gerenzanensis]SBO91943.1 Substrate-specific component NikM of nickel ECF transporter [Nonomuraea gerenzanensis]